MQFFKLVLGKGSWELIHRVFKTSNAVDVISQKVAVFIDLLLKLLSGQLGVIYVCVDTIVRSTRNGDCEYAVARVIEVYFHRKRDGLVALERHLHPDLLFGDTQISPIQEINLHINIRKLLLNQVLNIDVLVPTIDDIELGSGLLCEVDYGKDEVWLVKV